ncbi:uncharacterized protein LOC131637950 isoform X2 [Vicia villosa]|uniref:uncharacterized protein LOC131637950 isoform X2 n=1 Tax=Vicia villosa TaxID=3911 RepID=UPI00273B0248|nr:uncharacterized protein LOC131637950 isoform X2 [Vicia villosa]
MEKVLRVNSMLEKNQFVVPVPSSTLKKSSKNRKVMPKNVGINQDSHKDGFVVDSDVFDMWGDKDEDNKKVKKSFKMKAMLNSLCRIRDIRTGALEKLLKEHSGRYATGDEVVVLTHIRKVSISLIHSVSTVVTIV